MLFCTKTTRVLESYMLNYMIPNLTPFIIIIKDKIESILQIMIMISIHKYTSEMFIIFQRFSDRCKLFKLFLGFKLMGAFHLKFLLSCS